MLNARLRRTSPVLAIVLACAIGVIVGSALLVVARTGVRSLDYELDALEERAEELTLVREKLAVEAAALASPERIEPRARAIGLRYPEPGQIVPLPTRTDVAAGNLP